MRDTISFYPNVNTTAKNKKPVEVKKTGETEWVKYNSLTEAMRETGETSWAFFDCFKGKNVLRGFEARYVDNSLNDLDGEVWKDAIGKELQSGWKVSSFGRYRSSRGIVSYGNLTSEGYYRASMRGKKIGVHVLVARTFIGAPPSEVHTVNHKDGNRSNNKVENLEWATPREQALHAARNPNRKSHALAQSKAVEGRKVGTDLWTVYTSLNHAANLLGLRTGLISACCNGGQKTTNGYEFRLVPQENENLPGEIWKVATKEALEALKLIVRPGI